MFFILAFLAAFGRGSKIAVTRPGYPAYLNTLDGLGMEAVEIPVTAAAGWRLTAADIEAAYVREKFDGLLFASPTNPTGAAVTREGLREIVETCARLGVQFISDEIYHGLDYRAPSVSALEFTRDAIVINSFSKYYCMTGWRIGWMVLPEPLLNRTYMLQQNLFIAAPTLSQIAGRVALGERDYSEAQKAQYAENRHALAEGLAQFGLATASEGDGAFYAYVDFSRYTNDSLGFCIQLLEQSGVAATPGIDFDRLNGNRFVRFSYAGTRATIDEGLNRIEGFLRGAVSMDGVNIPIIETVRLRLRGPVLEDFPAFERIMTSDRAKFMGGPFDRSGAWGMLCHDIAGWGLFGHGGMMIDRRTDGVCVGQVSINHGPLFPEKELGWMLYEGFEGQGFAVEAAAALRNWAFDTLGLETLVSYVDPDNLKSIAVAGRLGAVLDPDAPREDPEDLVFRHRRAG